MSKDKIKDANGVPKESLVINGVTSETETDENKQRRMFIDSDSIIIDGEIKANNIRIRQGTSDFDGIANIGFMKTTEPFLFIEGAKGSDGLNRTQIASHVAVTTGIVCNGEIRCEWRN